MTSWGADKIEILRDRWIEKRCTIDRIAAILGMSRGAVAGKLSRLGLLGRGARRKSDFERQRVARAREARRQRVKCFADGCHALPLKNSCFCEAHAFRPPASPALLKRMGARI